MKKIFLLIFAILMGIGFITQAQTSDYDNNGTVDNQFNQWSVSFMAGFNRPLNPFTQGYYSVNPGVKLSIGSFRHFNLGTRYMLSRSFGFSLNLSYDNYVNPSGSSSKTFNTSQYLMAIQGVVNLGHVIGFPDFTHRFGLLMHTGFQLSRFNINEGPYDGEWERNGGFIFGLTPQIKISERFTFLMDGSYELNIKQHRTWDGNGSNPDNLVGGKITLSVGLAVNLGKHKKHADWADTPVENTMAQIETLTYRINELQQSTVKPETIDSLKNNQAKIRNDVDELNNKVTAMVPVGNNAPQAAAVSKEYSVFFDFNSARVKSDYLSEIASVIAVLKDNPNLKVLLQGFTDVRGTEKSNMKLSKRRADAVAEMLKKGGIDASCIKTEAKGVDKLFKAKTPEDMMFNRRVTIKLLNK